MRNNDQQKSTRIWRGESKTMQQSTNKRMQQRPQYNNLQMREYRYRNRKRKKCTRVKIINNWPLEELESTRHQPSATEICVTYRFERRQRILPWHRRHPRRGGTLQILGHYNHWFEKGDEARSEVAVPSSLELDPLIKATYLFQCLIEAKDNDKIEISSLLKSQQGFD